MAKKFLIFLILIKQVACPRSDSGNRSTRDPDFRSAFQLRRTQKEGGGKFALLSASRRQRDN